MVEIDDNQWTNLYLDYDISRRIIDNCVFQKDSLLYKWHMNRVLYLEKALGLVSDELCYNQLCQGTIKTRK